MVYGLILSYRGTRYAGWQRQSNALAVQQVVEEALADLLRQPVRLFGASRTDAGVHARGQVAHFELAQTFPERGLVGGLNQRLPEDIRVMAARRMEGDFHALRCAASKLYRYRLSRAPVISPLDAEFVVPVHRGVDPVRLQQAAAALPGRHDFTAFAVAGGSHGQPFRSILAADWEERGCELVFSIEGEGFLRGMVRGLVGTLVEVGTGRRNLHDFRRLLEGCSRSEAGPTAPARGLVLERIAYAPPWSSAFVEHPFCQRPEAASSGTDCGNFPPGT